MSDGTFVSIDTPADAVFCRKSMPMSHVAKFDDISGITFKFVVVPEDGVTKEG